MSALAARDLDPQERLDWLRLSRTESVGPVTFFALLRRFGSAAAAIEALPRLSVAAGQAGTRSRARGRGGTRRDRAARRHGCCAGASRSIRAVLAAVEDAPPVLTVLGRAELLGAPIVAVVGARNASANGRRLARELAAGLGEAGVVVASGMARGIDAAAHLGALDSGTVAVRRRRRRYRLSRGESRPVRCACGTRGAIVAELPLGSRAAGPPFPAPQPHHLGSRARGRRGRGGGANRGR